MKTDLSKFTTGDYNAGPKWKVLIWFFINYYIFHSSFPWPYRFKAWLLRLFGAKVGKGVVFKTKIRIKNPWRLSIGDNCWIGESVWIDNLEDVIIGQNVCLSQGAMLLTGNHDYTRIDFPYRLGKIHLEDGVWIGAKSVVCPGITCKANSILTVNSVANRQLDESGIYAGNPAVYIRERKFADS
ncbi:WcaF family extracellular polysaccharide biosynthesis acetyltransferase [Mucilaginibacter sp. PPCGB 2223]|uniref:WcaF family extracellular polysaccharide biosynthesis acetyltransferase n=1 Tax=Mucilaginibacter sp. PPCGB 2223 TaxID=1886027 RepID=UPI001C2FB1FE|nr:WcaF family extracellular polysaccharide biosynthesis acetyltransferase [Mucilaginibacter sp. PPCGB 2223]